MISAATSIPGTTPAPASSGAPAPASTPVPEPTPGLQVGEDGFEVHVKVPRIIDPRHPEASEAVNHAIFQRFAEAEANCEPLPDATGGWLEGGGKKVYDDGHVVSVTLGFDCFTGGAHPNNWVETVLYDGDHGREAKLGDLFIDKTAFLKDISREVTADLTRQNVDEGFISSSALPSAENFASFEPTAEGLTFLLPPARTGPYGGGIFEARVSWDHLRPSLDPQGPFWRQAAEFAWDKMPPAEGASRRQSFERLLALHRDPTAPPCADPKNDPHAAETAIEYLAVAAAGQSNGTDLLTLTDQFALLHQALDRCHQPGETLPSFEFIEKGLQEGAFGTATREEVTTRFVSGLLHTGTAEQARAWAQCPPSDQAGTVERGAETVVINGIRLPVKQ